MENTQKHKKVQKLEQKLKALKLDLSKSYDFNKKIKTDAKQKFKNPQNQSSYLTRFHLAAIQRYALEVKKQTLDIQSSNSTLPSDSKKILKMARSRIPYSPSSFMNGTQNPTIRIRGDMIPLVAATGTFNQVIASSTSLLPNWANFGACFDEYRYIKLVFHVIFSNFFTLTESTGTYGLGNCPMAVAVIDYDEGGALATIGQGMQYDQKKVSVLDFRSHCNSHYSIEAFMQPLPDQEWITTATSNYSPAWLKFFSDSGALFAGGEILGNAWIEVDVQFRGVD